MMLMKRMAMSVGLVLALLGAVMLGKVVYGVGVVLAAMADAPAETRADLQFLRAARVQAIQEAQRQQAAAKKPLPQAPAPVEKPE